MDNNKYEEKEKIDEFLTKDDHENVDKDQDKKPFLKELYSFTKEIVITILVVFFIITFVVQPTTVDGHSMNPTLQNQDQLLIEKVSQRFSGIERYDIIVFPYEQENKYFIKRVIGMPGETIDIVDGLVYIDGEVLDEPHDFDLITEYGSDTLPLTIPEGHYFVLGDNRNHSKDSRYSSVGFIAEDDILGKAFVRLWPFSSFGFLD